jgi:hypothetical protein
MHGRSSVNFTLGMEKSRKMRAKIEAPEDVLDGALSF